MLKLIITLCGLCYASLVYSQTEEVPIYAYAELDHIILLDEYGEKQIIDYPERSQYLDTVGFAADYAHAALVQFIKREDEYHVCYSNSEDIFYLYSDNAGKDWKRTKVDGISNYDIQDYHPVTGEHIGPTDRRTYIGLSGLRLALDSKGNPHLAYVVTGGNYHYDSFAIYAHLDNGEWQTEKVLTDEGYPKRHLGSIAVDIDSKDNAHVIVHSHEEVNTRRHSLAKFTKKRGKWIRQEITKRNTGSPSMNLIFDKGDNIHVMTTISTDSLFYWYSEDMGKTWEETYLKAGNCRAEMRLDADGVPHMSSSCYNDGIYYGLKTKNGWSVRGLEGRAQMCHSGIAINSEGTIYVTFYGHYHFPTDAKQYVKKKDGNWEAGIAYETLGKRGSACSPPITFAFREKEEAPDSSVNILVYEERPISTQHEYASSSKKVTIQLVDYAKQDNDSISLKINGEWILEEHLLTKEGATLEIELEEKEATEIILYALNEGSIPPCTALVIIDDGKQKKRFKISSSLGESGGMKVWFDDKK